MGKSHGEARLRVDLVGCVERGRELQWGRAWIKVRGRRARCAQRVDWGTVVKGSECQAEKYVSYLLTVESQRRF